MIYSIKWHLRLLKLKLKCIIRKFKSDKSINRNDNQPICWLIGTPEHRNLGDHAITLSSVLFIKSILPWYSIEEITEDEFYDVFYVIKKTIKQDDFIILQGGGNLGNQYIYTEHIRRLVIKTFKNMPIIIFPQTIHFSADKIGKIEEKKTKQIYSKHKNLKLFARENTSFDMMRTIFTSNQVYCVPDIVLSLINRVKLGDSYLERNGVICCLRDDIEGKVISQEKEQIMNFLKEVFDEVIMFDTVLSNSIKPKERKNVLKKSLEYIASTKLVVTDRLHGMIFSLLTHTPCIVFSNYNHKVKGVYQWLKDIPYIKMIDNIKELDGNLVDEIMIKNSNEDELLNNVLKAFEPLEKALIEVGYGKNKKVY